MKKLLVGFDHIHLFSHKMTNVLHPSLFKNPKDGVERIKGITNKFMEEEDYSKKIIEIIPEQVGKNSKDVKFNIIFRGEKTAEEKDEIFKELAAFI